MRIQNNIMAINTHRQLGGNNNSLSKSTEKLSSGFRVNRAADDAAGLTISEKMRAQIRGLSQASANAQDGISLIQTAEGALQESHSILQRMRELAVNAANDTLEEEDRNAVQAELNQLTKEIDRIAYTTEFNKKTLLDGSISNDKFTKLTSGTGFSATSISQTTTLGAYTIRMETLAQAAVYSLAIDQTTQGTIGAGTISVTGLYDTATEAFNYAISDQEIKSGSRDELLNNVASKINLDARSNYTASFDSGVLVLTAKEAQATNSAAVPTKQFDPAVLFAGDPDTGIGLTVDSNATVVGPGGATTMNVTTAGVNATFTATAVDKTGATITLGYASYNLNTGYVDIGTSSTNVAMSLRIEELDKFSAAGVTVEQGASLTMQVGANSGSSQTLRLAVGNLSAKSLGIDQLNVANHINAQGAVDAIESALQRVSKTRSDLGAVQNRLEHTIANVDTVGENLTAAESRIRDVDMAKEMMKFTTSNILIQASTAMLAQANQAPQNVLKLLG